ncbi:MAG: hypothetical protein ACOYKE_07875 [Ferruginibacter sp.]
MSSNHADHAATKKTVSGTGLNLIIPALIFLGLIGVLCYYAGNSKKSEAHPKAPVVEHHA